MELTLDQALQKGVEAHKAGKAQDADRYYTAILRADPKHPDANHNMGVLAVGVGKVDIALPFFKAALESNPSVGQYWHSYIDALIKLDRIADAKAVLEQEKRKGAKGDGFDQLMKRLNYIASSRLTQKDPPEKELEGLITLYEQGQYQEVQIQASQILKRFPDSITLYNLCGAANQGLGRQEEAIQAYEKAISIEPYYAEAYNNMGVTLQAQGKLDKAIETYNKALSIEPDNAEVYNNLGNALLEQGNLDGAIAAYDKAISIKPDFEKAYYNLGIALNGIIFKKPNGNLQKTIVSLLDRKKYVRPSDIAKAAVSLLKLDPNLQKHLKLVDADVTEKPLDIISDLSKLPLLLKLMSVCPLPDLDLEKLLQNLRHSILSNLPSIKEASPELIRFQSALALQCFTNEYIYNTSDEEEKIFRSLEASVRLGLNNNEQPTPQALLTLASYKALNKYDWCKLLVLVDDIKEIFIRQVEEPNHEEKLKHDLPILEEINDKVSSKVRTQYEESPYPRWVHLETPFKPLSISKLIDEVKLKLYDNKITNIEKPEILIAGCGTGQHSIGSAARFKSSTVLAIDLSLSSLAYAKRKTKELGIENIKYMQADILDLAKLNKKFDIIESSGVLHHMDNPLAGWKVLTDCLKPGGLMKIGLYSELARQHIVKIREEIKQLGIGSSDFEIRAFRESLMKSEMAHHRQVSNFHDFYSLSEFKDLIFHVQEHRFTTAKIKKQIEELGLQFCGFEAKKIVSNFKKINKTNIDPYDLDEWQVYEEGNKRAFTGMYQFWCQKVD